MGPDRLDTRERRTADGPVEVDRPTRALQSTDGLVQAVGATFGAAGIGEVLGAEPYLVGVTVGVPVYVDGAAVFGPSVYLRWAQEF